MRGLIPKTVSAENKLKFGLTFERIIVIGASFMIASNIGSFFVHAYFQFVFPLFVAVVAAVLTRKDPTNPTKKLWEGLRDFYTRTLIQPKQYLPIIGATYEHNRTKERQKNEK